ncbi:MAG: hypothetical protein QOG80_1494 [Pseudonocardiales bacterium]|nr:hypothetical protein [Pseudonocardiales bacterium]
MRWDELFDDLEAQLVEAELADLQAEVSDRERREVALLHLVDRLRPVIGEPVTVRVLGAGVIGGRLSAFGPDWLLLAEVGGREALVAATAVLAVGGLAAQTSAPHSEGAVAARLNLAFALRAVVRDRAAVTVTLTDGTAEGGTLDRVGADFLELAAHPPDEARRRDAVRSIRTYPLTAVALVRRA